MSVPRLHLVTDDAVLRRPDFLERSRSFMEAGGPAMAFHLRGHGTTGAELFRLADALAAAAAATGSLLLVNDRVDIALAAGCGAQLGRRSVPVRRARDLLGGERVLGYSAHHAAEAATAVDDGADFVLLGTIWPSPSHPAGAAKGPGLVRAVAGAMPSPVIAIGGVTAKRAREALESGAHGVAILSAAWGAADPAAAVAEYLDAMGAAR